MAAAHDAVYDICAIKTNTNGKRTITVFVYITPNTSLIQIYQFFILNLLTYTHKPKGLFEYLGEFSFDNTLIILNGNLNLNLRSENGIRIL